MAKKKYRLPLTGEPDEYLTIGETADEFRVSRPTIRRTSLDGSFPKPLVIGCQLRWLRSDLEAFKESQVNQPSEKIHA